MRKIKTLSIFAPLALLLSISLITVTAQEASHAEPGVSASSFTGSVSPIADSSMIEVLSGTVTISQQGVLLEVNGEIKVHPRAADAQPLPDLKAQESITTDERKQPTGVPSKESPGVADPQQVSDACYIHYAYQNIGSTRYERRTEYCVNGSGNEVVTSIKITNIGANIAPLLIDEEIWGYQCPSVSQRRWYDGALTYTLHPGAGVQWSVWVEVATGWNNKFKVNDVWQSAGYFNCVGK